ncbi:hypothetical protein Y88_0086 [Novosphingobium nitrogenifigens DSM 19370]|uniref:PilZ domain-containing protein n=1 Tax=Novosphingobium nitrogenifigens DSM 19370 TaxID=983920 RepID=F1ZBH9_9SPHN|nr:hypothetical protein [Novosphingobium nitrogenifigens]EGD58034.1 hypothetical protein Y88_0086 [Novosphingobium nitrogenifigens DSM 19370]
MEKRIEGRAVVGIEAKCSTVIQTCEIDVVNISIRGYCIRHGRMSLHVGQKIVLRIDCLEGLGGEVVWLRDGYAGILFERAMYEPSIDHICRYNRDVKGDDMWQFAA